MPRQLKEIKNFNLGTILNVSEKDTPKHSAVFSLNVNPTSENGILTSINCDSLWFFFRNNKVYKFFSIDYYIWHPVFIIMHLC